jgi:PAS domain S-box-containing protein
MPEVLCQPSVMSYAEARFATALVLLSGEIVDANRSTSDLFGEESPTQLFDRKLSEWITCSKQLDQLLRASDEALQIECGIRRSDGETRTVMISAWTLPPGQSGVPAKEIVMEDITERRQLELQLQQSQKMEALGRLAGGVAHDFNNLLMVIRGTCELMVLRHSPDEGLSSRIQVIANATEQGARLTRQLLAFSRRQILQPQRVEINQSLREFRKMLRHLIGEDIELNLELASEPLATIIDPGQLDQVLLNVSVNAREAMPSGGMLRLRSSRQTITASDATEHESLAVGEYVVIAIEDTGCGIPEATLPHIFEPFFTTKWQGTGLGLATAYGIIKQSSGSIEVESKVGVGTIFNIFLPRSSELPSVTSEREQPSLPSTPATILIVEDEEMVRKGSAEFLTLSGYTVYTACDGVEGLAVAKQHPEIELVITDVVMPRMRGTEMALELRRQNPEIPILFMTGYTQVPLELSQFQGASMLHKPFALAEITRCVQALLQSVASTRRGKLRP